MRIVIINMPDAVKRMNFQQAQMDKLGLEFERFEAITPATLPQTITDRYWTTWERPMSLGERACLLSHRAQWQSVKDSNQPALILEDDVLLSRHLPALLKEMDEPGPNKYQHLSLEVRNRKKLVSTSNESVSGLALKIHRLYQDRTGAAAYILWPGGAMKLLRYTDKKAGLADAMISSAYQMRSYQIEPGCALQFDVCEYYDLSTPFDTQSATHGSPKPDKPNLEQNTTYRVKRLKSQLSLGFRQISKSPGSRRRYIKLNKEDFN